MIYLNGSKGKRSKAEGKLSADVIFGTLQLCVWENGNITHSFYPGEEFFQAFEAEVAKYRQHQEYLAEGQRQAQERRRREREEKEKTAGTMKRYAIVRGNGIR